MVQYGLNQNFHKVVNLIKFFMKLNRNNKNKRNKRKRENDLLYFLGYQCVLVLA